MDLMAWANMRQDARAPRNRLMDEAQQRQEAATPISANDLLNLAKGAAAGVAGAPADVAYMAGGLNRMAQGTPPQIAFPPMQEQPLTSDWIGQKMGADVESGPFIAGSIGVPGLDDLAPMMAKGGKLLGAVMGDPSAAISAAAGAVKAGRNGEKLGGGLPMDQASRMQRAKEMGYDIDAYHGTADDVTEFSYEHGGKVTQAKSAKGAFWFVDDPEVASGYADLVATSAPVQKLIDASYAAERRGDWDAAHDLMVQAEKLESELVGVSGAVMPVKLKSGNFMQVDADGATMADLDDGQLNSWIKEAKKGGFDGLKIDNFSDNADYGAYRPATHYAVFDPASIRSKNANFDPAKRNSANILAGGAAGAVGIGALAGYGQNREY